VSGSTFRGDPYSVLDVRHDATSEEIKKRWRDLAREHHPDRAGGDGTERARLTTRMARINAAYDVLRDPIRRARYDSTPEGRRSWSPRDASERPPGGPPAPPPTRPVTARFDTTAVFHRRNATIGVGPAGLGGSGLHGVGPVEWRRRARGRDLRASTPTGPVQRSFVGGGPRLPSLADARATVLGFGRFHGWTLAQVAEREPAYIDWIASTITRDRDLVMRARVVAADLDEQGVERRRRPAEA
jgi:curved DNA-binding protein CbpA